MVYPSYLADVAERGLNSWIGTDRADARPSAEIDNPTLYFGESVVGFVGDGLLAADFTFYVHALAHRPEERHIIASL